MRGVTVMEVTGAVVIFDKYHEYKYKISSPRLTTNLPVLKDGENNIEDTSQEGQNSAEHLGLVMSHKIFAVY